MYSDKKKTIPIPFNVEEFQWAQKKPKIFINTANIEI